MKMPFFVSLGLLLILSCSLFIVSCNDDDEVPVDTTPLQAEPASISLTTGSIDYIAVSGGEIPYSIQAPPDENIAQASIVSIGVVTVTPVNSGTTSITIQDNSVPPRLVTIPITVTIGFGSISYSWTINGQSPTYMCGQVNSAQIRVTIDGYSPVTHPCGESSFILNDITAGSHTISAQLLNPDLNVLASVSQSVNIAPNQSTNVAMNFSAPLIIGSLQFSWTINGQPTGSGCANATSVRAALGSLAPFVELCSTGHLVMNSIPAGPYTFTADLLDAGNTSLSHLGQSVIINTNQTTYLNLNFTTGAIEGSATVSWTINEGLNCTPNGNIHITATGPSSSSINTSCDDYSYHFTHLGPGTYTFNIVLTDPAYPGQQSIVEAQNITVSANADASVTRNLDCLFCGGTSSTGWVQVDVTCGGGACGLTGTLYVIVKDCAGSAALNTGIYELTTISGAPVSHTLDNVLSGSRCLTVFLDVNGNHILDSGDAVSGLGQSSPFVVFGGQTTTVNFMLDSVNP